MTRKSSSRAGSAPTVNDVALRAGVSAMTVSRVLNRTGYVREATRAKVEAAIAELDYVPNPAARKLAGTPQVRIALVFGNPSRAWQSEFLTGCVAEASRSNVRLLLEQCDNEAAVLDFAARATSDLYDAVVIPPPFCDNEQIVERFVSTGLRIGTIASGRAMAGTLAVMINNRAAAYDMTRHLLELGHRRIGFIMGDTRQTGSHLRFEGFCAALKEFGLGPNTELVAHGDYTYRSGLIAASDLLKLADSPTAIFASNDDMAVAAISAAQRFNFGVPERLSVAGFDDTPLATTISPELTTVRQPVFVMAQALIAMLVSSSQQQRSGIDARPEHRIFAHEIIQRESTTLPPAVIFP